MIEPFDSIYDRERDWQDSNDIEIDSFDIAAEIEEIEADRGCFFSPHAMI